MPVDNPKQNKHEWWGELTIDSKQGDLVPGQKCIFFKTNRDSHIVSQGTLLVKVGVFKNLADATKVVLKEAKSVGATAPELKNISIELRKASAKNPNLPIVEIQDIDYANTPPLTVAINILTESLFQNGTWLYVNQNIGRRDIELGLKLCPLPLDRTRGVVSFS